jgi:hypothetical protein
MELMNVEPADSTIKQDRMVYIERMTNWDTTTQAWPKTLMTHTCTLLPTGWLCRGHKRCCTCKEKHKSAIYISHTAGSKTLHIWEHTISRSTKELKKTFTWASTCSHIWITPWFLNQILADLQMALACCSITISYAKDSE